MRAKTATVVGAGVGGLTAALALARRGLAVAVHERAAALGEVGAGLQISPNGVHVLRALGLDVSAARPAAPPAVEMRDGPTGRLLATVPLGRAAEDRYGAPYLQIHRADLLAMLAAAVEAAGVPIHLGSGVYTDDPPQADVVIAADGIRSGFRSRIAPGYDPAFTNQVAWRALVPAKAAPAAMGGGSTQLLLGPGRHLVLYPIRGGAVWNLVAVEERLDWSAEGWHQRADRAALRVAFSGWAAPVPALLEAVDEVIEWGLFAHGPLPRWSDGNTTLLGDACHPMLPFLAQGATMAIEDAWVLAHSLASRPIPEALAAYEAARKPRTVRVHVAAARNARVYHLRSGLARRGLGLGLRLAARRRGGLLRPFDWLYGANVAAG